MNDKRMRVSFWVSSGTRPVGGVKTIFEFANGLSRLGHTVNLIHFELAGHSIASSEEIGWFDIDSSVHQMVIREGDGQTLPPADFLFPYHELLAGDAGLPVNLVPGYRMMPPELMEAMFHRAVPEGLRCEMAVASRPRDRGTGSPAGVCPKWNRSRHLPRDAGDRRSSAASHDALPHAPHEGHALRVCRRSRWSRRAFPVTVGGALRHV